MIDKISIFKSHLNQRFSTTGLAELKGSFLECQSWVPLVASKNTKIMADIVEKTVCQWVTTM